MGGPEETLLFWKSIEGRCGLVGGVCDVLWSVLNPDPDVLGLQQADLLVNLEGQTFGLLCSFKRPGCP